MRFFGTKEIKEHVNRVLANLPAASKGARAIDFPAGNGVTSECLHSLGAEVLAIDLFPELFRFKLAKIIRGDLSLEFPVSSESFDLAVCQEGIEHVGNQDHVLREFARVLKPGGKINRSFGEAGQEQTHCPHRGQPIAKRYQPIRQTKLASHTAVNQNAHNQGERVNP